MLFDSSTKLCTGEPMFSMSWGKGGMGGMGGIAAATFCKLSWAYNKPETKLNPIPNPIGQIFCCWGYFYKHKGCKPLLVSHKKYGFCKKKHQPSNILAARWSTISNTMWAYEKHRFNNRR